MIKLEHISKTFGDTGDGVHAVKDVSLEIGDGEIFGIIGFSGAGKSTLVRCINLLEQPTSGSITVNGQKLTWMEKQADGKEQFRTGTQSKTDGTISLTLEPASVNPAIKEELSAEWPDFRGSASNNAVTDAKIPFSAEDGTLYWSSGVRLEPEVRIW